MSRVSGMSGDYPFSLPRAYLLGRPAVCCSAVLPVCPCIVSFCKFHEPDTHDLLYGQVASILVASSSDTSDTPHSSRQAIDILARMSRECYEDAARKLLPWNLRFTERPAKSRCVTAGRPDCAAITDAVCC